MNYFDRYDADEEDEQRDRDQPRTPSCNRCGNTIRWRQQGGKWVPFSLQPGKEHVCPVKDEFDALD